MCCRQVEVTFNFLEIRAMNTYPEHQVTRPGSGPPLFRPIAPSLTNSGARAGHHRHGQDHLLVPVADPGPAGSHGRPHQLRALARLQQLHLRVSSPTRGWGGGTLGGWSFTSCVGRLRHPIITDEMGAVGVEIVASSLV